MNIAVEIKSIRILTFGLLSPDKKPGKSAPQNPFKVTSEKHHQTYIKQMMPIVKIVFKAIFDISTQRLFVSLINIGT